MAKRLREVNQNKESNHKFPLADAQELYPGYTLTKTGSYYPYNEQYIDRAWGCAWRAIQLVLSSIGKDTDFSDLFHIYSTRKKLLEIARRKFAKCIKTDVLQKVQTWAPEENQNNWAEPFIGQLICQDFGLSTELFLVDGFPKCYAPREVFDMTLNFESFWKKIKQAIPHSAIMIDDGQIALGIIGYYEKDEKRHLILADPHIVSNRQFRNTGIYQVILNAEGKLLEWNVGQKQKDQILGTYKSIYFFKKKWMVLCVKANQKSEKQ